VNTQGRLRRPAAVLWGGCLYLIAIVVLGSGLYLLYLWWVKRIVAFETGLNTAQCSDMDDVMPMVSVRQGSEA
jgi:hypothetical protein